MNLFQTNINTIIAALYAKGLRQVVICPGSRNAPLVMAAVRFGKLKCISVADERTAGFIAMGMAKQLNAPVAVICTSGTAVLNLYPAIAEAFYMQIPFLAITADRPKEMLDRWDGQTIHQEAVFEPHVIASYSTPEDLDFNQTKTISQIASDFYSASMNGVKGPVHLNVPLKEPLYAAAKDVFVYPEITADENLSNESDDWEIAIDKSHFFVDYPKVMVLHGADSSNANTDELKALSNNHFAIVISDIISNKHAFQNIQNWEGVFLNASEEVQKQLLPDLLITTGKMVLNKTLKNLLRNYAPKRHWHIAENGYCADTFFTEPEILSLAPATFFQQFNQFLPKETSSYYNQFKLLAHKQKALSERTIYNNYNEFGVVKKILNILPENIVLHLANSMSIRYVAYLNESLKDSWEVYSNRGASGIDGCTSTAIGAAMVSYKLHALVTGDIAFFYDINALWQEHMPTNFKIVILNNFGGGIFQNIDGPAQLPELNPFIGTPHSMDASLMAQHFKLNYFSVNSFEELNQQLPGWLLSETAAILEIKTDANINSTIFNQYKHQII